MEGHAIVEREIETPQDRRGLPRWAQKGVTWRSLLLTLLLAPLCMYWQVFMEVVFWVGSPTLVSFFYHIIFVLVVLSAGNALIRRYLPRAAMSQSELLVVYTLLCVTSACGGYDWLHWQWADIAGPVYRATPENRWQEVFFEHLPRSLVVQDKAALKGFYEGGSTVLGFYGNPSALEAWAEPAFWWIIILSLAWLGPLGLSVLFRRRWQETEKLTFPIAQVPYEVTNPRSHFLRDRALWWMVAIVTVINITNGLHVLSPKFPLIPIAAGFEKNTNPALNISNALTDRPWNAAGHVSLAFYPMIVGLGLLLPSELAISCVVFFFFFKAQWIAKSWLGLQGPPEWPFQKEQSLGGYLGILLFSLWIGRSYYTAVLRAVLRRDREVEAGEPASYRGAALLFVACFVGLVVISMSAGPKGMQFGQGMGLWQAAFHWGVYYVLALICGRIRAEMGLPVHEIERLGPVVLLGNTFSTKGVGARSLTVASTFFGLSRGMRSVALPFHNEGYYLMERSHGSSRRLYWAMAGALVLGTVLAWAVYLPVFHWKGAVAKCQNYPDWHTGETLGQLMGWLENPHKFAWNRVIPTGLGLVFYFAMMTLKTRVSWWPLHPIGFALSSTWYMHHMWCPLLIAWLLKYFVTRYAGNTGTRKLVPVALGLILGDVMSGCAWTIYGLIKQKEVYAFFR